MEKESPNEEQRAQGRQEEQDQVSHNYDTDILKMWSESMKDDNTFRDANLRIEEAAKTILKELQETGKTTWGIKETPIERDFRYMNPDDFIKQYPLITKEFYGIKIAEAWAEKELAKIKLDPEEEKRLFTNMLLGRSPFYRIPQEYIDAIAANRVQEYEDRQKPVPATYTDLQEIIEDLKFARGRYNADNITEETDEILNKLKATVLAQKYIQDGDK